MINGISSVKKGVRQKVLSAIEELNYQPNRAARSLAGGRTNTLAFILPDICNPFFPEMVRGAMELANQASIDIFLANIDNDPQKEIKYIDSFVKRGVDGLIIATSDVSSKQGKHIGALNIPVVIVDRELQGLNRDLVIVDNYDCAFQAATHLIELGHQRVGIILGPEQTMTTRKRLQGVRDVLQERELFDASLVHHGSFSIDSGYGTMQAILNKGDPPSAVFCANDLLAIGAIKALQESGLNVPQDISVIGIDDIMLSSLVNPALTTIRQPTLDLGAMAAKLLIERIQGNYTGVHRKVILPGELIIRNSTRPYPAAPDNGGSLA